MRHQTYSEVLQTLFHTLQLNGYVFEKTDRLTPLESYDKYDDEPRYKSNVKSMFKKTILYHDDNSDYDIDTAYIRVNVEVDANVVEFNENVKEVYNRINYYYNLEKVKKFINKLRHPFDLPNVNVPTRVSNEVDDDERNPKKELQILFQTLDLHEYHYNETKPLTETNVQTVFQAPGYNLIVKIEFNPLDMMDEEDLNDDDETENDDDHHYNLVKVQKNVEKLINAPAARGKIKNKNSKKNKNKNSKKNKNKNSKKTKIKTQKKQK